MGKAGGYIRVFKHSMKENHKATRNEQLDQCEGKENDEGGLGLCVCRRKGAETHKGDREPMEHIDTSPQRSVRFGAQEVVDAGR